MSDRITTPHDEHPLYGEAIGYLQAYNANPDAGFKHLARYVECVDIMMGVATEDPLVSYDNAWAD